MGEVERRIALSIALEPLIIMTWVLYYGFTGEPLHDSTNDGVAEFSRKSCLGDHQGCYLSIMNTMHLETINKIVEKLVWSAKKP